MARRRKVRNVVCFSDTHIGCKLGLMHPDGADLDEGTRVMPSPLQLKVWGMWEEFWGEWVPKATKGEPFSVVMNGDAIDGVHHGSTTQWSQNLSDQRRHAEEKIFPKVRELCEGRLYWVRGTEAHVGKSATEEEQLAKAVGAVPSGETGHYARWDMWMTVGDGLVHFAHHIGTTSSAAHETSAVNAELARAFNDAGRWGRRPPDIIVRSHRHRFCEIRLSGTIGYPTAFVTPAWQLKTPFVHRIPGGSIQEPQVGGCLIRRGDEELHTRHYVRDMGRGAVE